MVAFVRSINASEKELIDQVVLIHKKSFEGFFLSTLHPGFLRQLYKSFAKNKKSDLLVAFDGEKPIGFLAYSCDSAGMYGYMLFRYFFPFAWYSFLSFLKKPSIFKKMFSAIKMPRKHVRETEYVKIFSIGVDTDYRDHGIGTQLMNELKRRTDFSKYDYITLETDANDNVKANDFYLKNGFRKSKEIVTFEGRKMNKYHFRSTDGITLC